MNEYLYEIVEDYKMASSVDEQKQIFDSFCALLWSSSNKRRVYTKVIRYRVNKNLRNTALGQVFEMWSQVEYQGYKPLTKNTDYISLIRQKINNLYTVYFDPEVIVKPDYIDLLKTPKQLYYAWLNGSDITAASATAAIDQAIADSVTLKEKYRKEKMDLPWPAYKKLMEGFLKKAFDNCRLIDEYENKESAAVCWDFLTEDNFYIKYFCRCLEGEMKKWQKKYYGVRDHQKYRRCIDCGSLYEVKKKDTTSDRCSICRYHHKKMLSLYRVKKHRKKKCNAAKTDNSIR